MAVIAVIGAQWGDEGKGKVVDFYAQQADVVVRFNGGDNAGHTVAFSGKTFKLHHVPSGVLSGKLGIIGNGCVVNPKTLLEELKKITIEGINPNLAISGRAHVVLPYHIMQDEAEEKAKGALAAGTTRRGIGPCYADKAARTGIRIGDLVEKETLKQKLRILHNIKTKTLESVYGVKFQQSADQVFSEYSGYGDQLSKHIGGTGPRLYEALEQKKKILLEGAQGSMLDIDHGAYPFGTSSNTTIGGASAGSGIPGHKINEVIGVVKVYTSRVGSGPLPTELTDETGNKIREKGQEYGTTTGRPRRIGWIDLVQLRHAHQVNGFTGLAFTRIDTLAGIPKLKLCTAYNMRGKRIQHVPHSVSELAACVPVYEEMPGWGERKQTDWRKTAVKGMTAVPDEAKNYIRRISEFLGVDIALVSVGPERESTITLKEVFAK